ncbi:TetR/AcrR family transcriptional regulator [Halioglobus pacificus]|uniref:HTH tetR-type domain-containing protein n=1 Tax=Parahalioglobus pacificus TaxID=930806 RepID=A0A918XGY7_9GAMM|nr:TetR/AcrR family transcriptional regulator [Halioglobus pacificus]GHD30305.1 hypothetical protein GCM10007053_11940 [Halioglobus pacificus]
MPKQSTATVPKTYHHGDLRNALIVAAAELISERGSFDFAMVEAARRAGVSNAAPYRHFRDKEALLEAVGQLGFLGLKQYAEHALENQEYGSIEAIKSLGHSYIRFVTSHVPFHDLMFGDVGHRAMGNGVEATDGNAVESNLSASGFYVLVGAVEAYFKTHAITRQNPVEIAVKMWATVHGMSALFMNHKVEQFLPDADIFYLMDTSIETFFDGLQRD